LEAAYQVGNTAVLDAVRRRAQDPALKQRAEARLELLAKEGAPIKLLGARDKDSAKGKPALLTAAKECAQQ
jgi:hypothetical protein